MKKRKFSKHKINKPISDSKGFSFNKKSVFLVLIVVGMISIMIGSALNFWKSSEKKEYKGYKFTKTENLDGRWASYINGRQYYFDFLPQEVENLVKIYLIILTNWLFLHVQKKKIVAITLFIIAVK